MISNERANIEVFVHVLHAMKVSIVKRSQPLQSKWPNDHPKSGALFRPRPEAVNGANAHVHYVLLDDGSALYIQSIQL